MEKKEWRCKSTNVNVRANGWEEDDEANGVREGIRIKVGRENESDEGLWQGKTR